MLRIFLGVLLLCTGLEAMFCPAAAAAAATSMGDPDVAAAGEVLTLAPITVIGGIETPATGKSTLAGEVIEKFPAGNNSLGEILRLLPDVQLNEGYNSATTGGEILSPTISISGGKVYQNNFLIDGVANNSLLDPASKNDNYVTDVPGHPEERSLSSDLIESVTVYDSNIPARWGNFTGGVVDVQSKDPGPLPEGKLTYRTTRSAWTRIHTTREDRDNSLITLQPRFEKHDYGLTLNLPFSATTGILASYRQLDSRIPFPYLNTTKSQSRTQQEFFLKYAWEVSTHDQLFVTLSQSPYREERFLKNVVGSDYTVTLGGFSLSGEWQHELAAGELRLSTAYSNSQNRRSGPQHFRSWASSDSKEWGRLIGQEFSNEGGFGDIEKRQENYTVHGSFTAIPFVTGPIRHEITSGGEYLRTVGSFARKETTYVYQGARLSADIVCGENTYDCIDQEQFFTARQVYAAGSSTATINQIAAYFEDRIALRQLELRPGLRLSHDDLMRNTDLAPRLAATYDLFADGGTLLIAGLNRYYGASLLTAKLREAQIPFRTESRASYNNRPLPWEPAAEQGPNATRFTELQSPYSDEVVLGVDQGFCGGRLGIKSVHRQGHDEFARTWSPLQPGGLRYYTLNNNGRSRHQSYRVSWERSWEHDFLSINANYQVTTSNNASYDSVIENEALNDQVWFDGRLIRKSELPAFDHNRPVVVNLAWVAELPKGLTFTTLAHYRSGYRDIKNTGELREIGAGEGSPLIESAEVYEETKYSDVLIFDWKVTWSPPLVRNLMLSLEIDNVLDSRSRTGGASPVFELGRQFWLGGDYRF